MCVGVTSLPRKNSTVPKQQQASDMDNLNVDDPSKRNKDNDFRFCTWNVRTLNRPRAAEQIVESLDRLKADITAIQEVRWDGEGIRRMKTCDIYFGECYKEQGQRLFGCGFVVRGRLRQEVLGFRNVSERLVTIRIKAKFKNVTLICAHAPTEEKDDSTKEEFYDLLEETYDRCPKYDVKIILGDFNAKIGKESLFGSIVGEHSLHDNTSGNGLRLIDFAAGRNVIIASTRFPHLNIHKGTWRSPDQLTVNQIDHVAIDARHASSILDVRTFRGANIDSDHYLVVAQVRMRISMTPQRRTDAVKRFNVARLKSQEVARTFADRVSLNLSASPPPASSTEDLWKHCQNAISSAATDVLGFTRPPQRNPWFDEECRLAHVAKNEAYQLMLQARTRAAERDARELYGQRRREERRLLRRKKREHAKRAVESIEDCTGRGDVRKFYQRVRQSTQGYKARTEACRDESGNMVVDTQSVLRIWKQHFSRLLNGEEGQNSAARRNIPFNLDDDSQNFRPPDLNEVRSAIAKLKAYKAAGADGLPAELFKAGGDDLVGSIHQLISKIWSDESMPNEWNLGIVCPIHKKGDALTCANYRGISLLNVAYKILSSILCERLKPFVNELIGPYQCGFRPGKSTLDQMFTLRQILEKTQEFQIDTHHLFIDFKVAYDSVDREQLYRAMSHLGIPAKLVRLCRMTMEKSRCSVKVGKNTTEPFDVEKGLRQGDALSCNLFNIALEAIVRNSNVNNRGTIFQKSVQLLAYADDIDIIGRTKRAVTGAFASIELEAAKMGLAVNEDKTKYMLSSRKESQHRRLGQNVTMDRYNFEVVKDFVYLGSTITTQNDISAEIKRRITLANRCFFGLRRHLSNKALSQRTKETLYKTLIIPVLLYGAEAWTLSKTDENLLGCFERKVLRLIFGPVCIDGVWRRRFNNELYGLYSDVDLVKKLKIQRLRWLGHVERMDTDAPARRIFESTPDGLRSRGRPHLRWRAQVESDLNQLGVRNWRQLARDRASWRGLLVEAVVHPGL